MGNQPPKEGEIHDVKRLRRLVELMNEHDLGEIDLRDGDVRIRLRKRQEMVVGGYEPRPVASSAPAPKAASAEPAAAASDAHLTVIKSENIGTFFSRPSPDAPAFVKVGDHVNPETIVCIIEAMKVFNEIPAGCSGQIVAVLVGDGEPVDFDKPLFKVDPGK